MPIYEYECKACGHRLETLQKISDPPLSDCPECRRPELKKLISAAAFRLKGGGWYETDFKKDKDKKKNLVQSESNKTDSGKKPEKSGKTTDTKTTSAGSTTTKSSAAGSTG